LRALTMRLVIALEASGRKPTKQGRGEVTL
jgi:hypothetical protein